MASLIEEIRSGNKDAVKAVYSEYAKDVYNFAKSITGDHDSALAATKKTFVKLFNNIKKGEEPENFRTALLKVAYDEACAIAMPAKEEEASVNVVTPTPIEESAKPQREEIYMPKGGYDSLQVEEEVPIETVEEELPRPKRRPEGASERPRRRPATDENGEELPRPKRRPRPDSEEGVERKRRPRPVPAETEEEEAITPRKRRNIREQELDTAEPLPEDVDVYDALDGEEGYEDEFDEDTEYEKPRSKGLFIFCIILNVILILILLWFLGGLLINLGVLPEFDLGYSWFNGHIYPLF